MSKILWHTIQIKVPGEMIELTKTGKVSIKKTLTKTFNISKSQKKPAIKLIPSDINKPQIVNDGKEWNVEELKSQMVKANALDKKNKGRDITKSEKRVSKLEKFKKAVVDSAREGVKKNIDKKYDELISSVKKMKSIKMKEKPEPRKKDRYAFNVETNFGPTDFTFSRDFKYDTIKTDTGYTYIFNNEEDLNTALDLTTFVYDYKNPRLYKWGKPYYFEPDKIIEKVETHKQKKDGQTLKGPTDLKVEKYKLSDKKTQEFIDGYIKNYMRGWFINEDGDEQISTVNQKEKKIKLLVIKPYLQKNKDNIAQIQGMILYLFNNFGTIDRNKKTELEKMIGTVNSRIYNQYKKLTANFQEEMNELSRIYKKMEELKM